MQNQKNNHKVSTLVKLLVLALAIFALTVVSLTACKEEEVTLEAVTVASNPNTVTYNLGETFDCAGATIKVTYSDGTTKTVNVTKDMLADNSAFDEVGDQLVAVVYAEGGVQKVTYITVVVYDQLGEDKADAINGLAEYKASTDRGVVAMYNDCVAAIEKAADAAAINEIVGAFKADVKAYTEAKAAALAEVASLYTSAASKLGGAYLAQADALKASAEVVIANAPTLVDVNTALADYKLSLEAILDDEVAYWELIAVKEEIIAKLQGEFTAVYGAKTHYYAPQQFMKLEDARDAVVAHIILIPYITAEDGDEMIEDLMGELEGFEDYIDWAYQMWAAIGNVKYRPFGAENYGEDSKKAIDAAIDALLTALNNIDGENYDSIDDIAATDGDAYKSLSAYNEGLTVPVNVIDKLSDDVDRYVQLNTAYDVAVAAGGLTETLNGLLTAIGGTVELGDVDAIEAALKAYIQWLIDYEMTSLDGVNLADAGYVAILDTILNADDATLYEYTKTATEDLDNSRGKMIDGAYTALNDVVVAYIGLLEDLRLDASEVIAKIDAIETKDLLAKRALIEAAEAAYKAWAEANGISVVTLDPANMETYGTVAATLSANAFVEAVNSGFEKLAKAYIVTNYAEMIAARETFDALYAEAYAEAQDVLAKIGAIDGALFDNDNDPATPAIIILKSGATVRDAKAAYEAWAVKYGVIAEGEYADTAYVVVDEENKEDETFIVSYDAFKAYTDDYLALYNQAVLDAKAVVDLIDAIGTVKFDVATEDNKDSNAAIEAAEAALEAFNAIERYTADDYDAATALMTAEKLQTLADARDRYTYLVGFAGAINTALVDLAKDPAAYTMRATIEAIYADICTFTTDNDKITSPLNLELFADLHESIYYQVYLTNQINASEFISDSVSTLLATIYDTKEFADIRTAINNAGNLYKGQLQAYAYNYAGTDAEALDAQLEDIYDILDDAINALYLNYIKAGFKQIVAEAVAVEPYIKDAAEKLLADETAKLDAILDAYKAGTDVDNPYLITREDGVFPVIVADDASLDYDDVLDLIYNDDVANEYIMDFYNTIIDWIVGYYTFMDAAENLALYMDAVLAELSDGVDPASDYAVALQAAFDVYKAELAAVEYVVTDDHDAQMEAIHVIFDNFYNVCILNALKVEVVAYTEAQKLVEAAIADDADALCAELIAYIDAILASYEAGAVDNAVALERTDANLVLPSVPAVGVCEELFACYGLDEAHALMVLKADYEIKIQQLIFDHNAQNPNPDDDNEAGFPTNP